MGTVQGRAKAREDMQMNLKYAGWCWVLAGLFLCTQALAEMPRIFHFEDYYSTEDGPYTGEIDLRLQLYSAPTGGNLLYEDSSVVSVVDGFYVTLIGDDTAYGSLSDVWAAGETWVQVVINGTPPCAAGAAGPRSLCPAGGRGA
jgi:hypothetical protein